jgi:hypothetical protein
MPSTTARVLFRSGTLNFNAEWVPADRSVLLCHAAHLETFINSHPGNFMFGVPRGDLPLRE